MEKLYRDYGGPFSMVLVLSLATAVFTRLAYGVDLVEESINLLVQREAFSAWVESSLSVLDLRRIQFGIQLAVTLILGLTLRKDLPKPALCLSFVLIFCYVPHLVYGLTSASLLIPGLCFFQCAAWAWWQNPRRSMSLLLPFAGLLVILCHPLFAFYVLPVMLLLFFRDISDGRGLQIKLSLLASLNFCVLLFYTLMMRVGWELSLELLRGEKTWPLMGAAPLPVDGESLWLRILPSAFHGFLFLMSLLMALLLPAKIFHYFLAGLAVVYVGASMGASEAHGPAIEAFLVFALPLLLGHLWKIRKALLPGERIPFAVGVALIALPFLYSLFDFQGLALGSLMLFCLTFVVGHLRGVHFGASLSSLTLAGLFVIAQYQNMPPSQSVRDAIEKIEQGVFAGLYTTRAYKNEFDSLLNQIKPLAGGPVSLFVDHDRPGYYLLLGLDPVPALPLRPERYATADVERILAGPGNLPDMVLLLPGPDSKSGGLDVGLRSFFMRNPAYRSYHETERFQLLVKAEFLDKLSH